MKFQTHFISSIKHDQVMRLYLTTVVLFSDQWDM